MATATRTAPSFTAPGGLHRYEWALAALGAAACVAATLALAAGHVAGVGVKSLAVLVFGLVTFWCLTERRVQRTLVVFALYVGMIDGYLKLKTGSPFVTLGRDVLLWAIALGALWRASGRENLRLPPLGGLVLAFCAVVVIQVANPQGPGMVGALGGLRQHLEFVPLFFLGYAFMRSEDRLRWFLVALVVCAAANGLASYVQSTQTPEQLSSWGPGYRDRVEGRGAFKNAGRASVDAAGNVHVRPFGLSGDSGGGALAAALALPALLVLLYLTTRWRRGLVGLAGLCICLAVVTSGSRSAIIACVASLFAFGLLAVVSRNGFRSLVALGVTVSIFYAVYTQIGPSSDTTRRAQSIAPGRALDTFTKERGDSLTAIGRLVTSYPLGVGVGTVGPAAGATGRVFQNPDEFDAETQWNFTTLEMGIPGLIVLFSIAARLLYLTFTRIRRFDDVELRLLLAAIGAPLVSMAVFIFAGPITVSAPTAPYLWFVTGILAFWLITAFEARRAGPER